MTPSRAGFTIQPCTSRRSPIAVAMLVTTIAVYSGCGGQEATTTVRGKVSYNGKPVTTGLINFLPQGGRPLGGPIDADGTYSFDLPPGEYQVRIDAPAPLPPGWKEGDTAPPPALGAVPEQYANFNTSGLTATVESGGTQTLDFALP